MRHITLTISVEPDGEYHVATCVELGTPSFGSSEDEADQAAVGASEAYPNMLENLGGMRQSHQGRGHPDPSRHEERRTMVEQASHEPVTI
jgi:hypothetical protein